ncbi:MAG: ABC transporter ATP-binding protein [Candidatus Methanoperedens sp.]
MPHLRTAGLYKTYWLDEIKIQSLIDINLSIEQGEFVAITGPSGSGKSTLLHLLGGIDTPTIGDVFIKETNVNTMKANALRDMRLRELGFVFQHFYLLPVLTAQENIELPMKEAGLPKAQRKQRIMELLDAVGLRNRANHMPGQLSGGEQQRIAIARSLANNPSIILADEPTGELDSANGRTILELLIRINREFGKTVIVVTHDDSLAHQATRIIKLHDGRIVQ